MTKEMQQTRRAYGFLLSHNRDQQTCLIRLCLGLRGCVGDGRPFYDLSPLSYVLI